MFDEIDVLHHPIQDDLAVQIANCLMDLHDGSTRGVRSKTHRLNMRSTRLH